MNKAPEIDFRGNDPFWLKNEGFGLTLYFPAFMPQKSFYLKECLGSDKLVFGVMGQDIPLKFILAMMQQGRLTRDVKGCWIRPEITPSGRVVMAVGIDKWKTKDEENPTAWSLTQQAYNMAHSWYYEKVKELWDQAKIAASYFNSPEPVRDDEAMDAEIVPPEQIEA